MICRFIISKLGEKFNVEIGSELGLLIRYQIILFFGGGGGGENIWYIIALTCVNVIDQQNFPLKVSTPTSSESHLSIW